MKNAYEEVLAFYKEKLSIETLYTAKVIDKTHSIISINQFKFEMNKIGFTIVTHRQALIYSLEPHNKMTSLRKNLYILLIMFSVYPLVIDFLFSVCARNKTIQRCFSNN